jgi:hypothetical protein
MVASCILSIKPELLLLYPLIDEDTAMSGYYLRYLGGWAGAYFHAFWPLR